MKYTVCLDAHRSNRPALLFQSLEREAIAKDPGIIAFFPNGYFLRAVNGRAGIPSYYGRPAQPAVPPGETLVSSVLDADLPDEATIETVPIRFFKNGIEYTINLRDRYNQCLSLFKAVGCRVCPERGAVCLSQASGTIPAYTDVPLDAETMLEGLTGSKLVIAGHEFVHPTSTRTEEFSKKLRRYNEHDFDAVADNDKKRSERATDAAETKKFKKTQCVKCVIKNSCDRSKWCKGAYPPEQDIIVQSEARLTAALKKSAWPEWQLWEVARHMSDTAKHSRWQIVLTGLKLQGADGLVATVHRAKGSITEYGKIKTYEEIAKVFNLALTEEDALAAKRGPVTDPKLRAVLWLTLTTSHARRGGGWGGSRQYITGVGCNDLYVTAQWTNGTYVGSVCDLKEVADIASKLSDGYVGDVEKIEVRR
jgi:hypothetical protein